MGRAPRGIAQDLPRRIDPGHPSGRVEAGCDVGMIFLGKPSIGSLDDLVLSLRIDLQDLVRILVSGHAAIAAIAAIARLMRAQVTMIGLGSGSRTNCAWASGAITHCCIARAD